MKNNKYWDSSGLYDSEAGKTLTLDHIYPVGSIYMSVNSTDPSNLFGGTWEQLQNRFLLAAGSAHAAGSTGGSENAIIPYHNHTFTGSAVTSGTQSANHTHVVNGGAHTHKVNPNTGGILFTSGRIVAIASQGVTAPTDWGVGATAASEGGHTHSVGANSANHTHSVTAAGTVGYAGTNGNVTGANMPPYLAVYMWKRTA